MVTVDIKRRENQSDKTQGKNEMQNAAQRKVFVPCADIIEDENCLKVIADMPGVNEKNVDINVEQRVLTISGKLEPEKPQGYECVHEEYVIGDYERSFTLSNEVDVEKIEAIMKQGVLTIILPKTETAKPKKIEVKAGK